MTKKTAEEVLRAEQRKMQADQPHVDSLLRPCQTCGHLRLFHFRGGFCSRPHCQCHKFQGREPT